MSTFSLDRIVKLALALVVVASAFVSWPARTTETPEPVVAPAPEPQDEMPEMPKPGAEHKWLAERAGKWNIVSKYRMQPDQPWTESTATENVRVICGGFWVEVDFRGDFSGMPFQGRQLMGYDSYKKKFVSVWIDSFSPTMMPSEGTYDKDTKTLTMDSESFDPAQGKMVKMQITVKDMGPDSSVFKMYSGEGDKKFHNMEMHYTRAK